MSDDFSLLEQFDAYAKDRNALRQAAANTNLWAGVPVPVDHLDLIIEPNYPLAEVYHHDKIEIAADKTELSETVIRNCFWSWHLRKEVLVVERNGRVRGVIIPDPTSQIDLLFNSLMASDAWGIEQEHRATSSLAKLVSHRKFKQYMLTGMFWETSKRSGVHYIFRRLRPTVAISTRGEEARILCTLCLHPIGFYENSWAGVMTPTDDVIAHLCLMRGDEHMFWRRSNQHQPWVRQSGL